MGGSGSTPADQAADGALVPDGGAEEQKLGVSDMEDCEDDTDDCMWVRSTTADATSSASTGAGAGAGAVIYLDSPVAPPRKRKSPAHKRRRAKRKKDSRTGAKVDVVDLVSSSSSSSSSSANPSRVASSSAASPSRVASSSAANPSRAGPASSPTASNVTPADKLGCTPTPVPPTHWSRDPDAPVCETPYKIFKRRGNHEAQANIVWSEWTNNMSDDQKRPYVQLASEQYHELYVYARNTVGPFALSPDQKTLLTRLNKHTFQLWRLGDKVCTDHTVILSKDLRELERPTDATVSGFAWSPQNDAFVVVAGHCILLFAGDGRLIATAANQAQKLLVYAVDWSVENVLAVSTVPIPSPTNVSSSSAASSRHPDVLLFTVDVHADDPRATLLMRGSLAIPPHTDPGNSDIRALRFSPDGQQLCAVTLSGTLVWWPRGPTTSSSSSSASEATGVRLAADRPLRAMCWHAVGKHTEYAMAAATADRVVLFRSPLSHPGLRSPVCHMDVGKSWNKDFVAGLHSATAGNHSLLYVVLWSGKVKALRVSAQGTALTLSKKGLSPPVVEVTSRVLVKGECLPPLLLSQRPASRTGKRTSPKAGPQKTHKRVKTAPAVATPSTHVGAAPAVAAPSTHVETTLATGAKPLAMSPQQLETKEKRTPAVNNSDTVDLGQRAAVPSQGVHAVPRNNKNSNKNNHHHHHHNNNNNNNNSSSSLKANKAKTRKSSKKKKPLPTNVEDWTTGQVRQWVGEKFDAPLAKRIKQMFLRGAPTREKRVRVDGKFLLKLSLYHLQHWTNGIENDQDKGRLTLTKDKEKTLLREVNKLKRLHSYTFRRVAILYANWIYPKHEPLVNPPRDVNLMYSVLTSKCGFLPEDVHVIKNVAHQASFKDQLNKKVRKTAENTIVFVYYGGHGLVKDNTTRLIPCHPDIDPADENFELYCLKVEELRDHIQELLRPHAMFMAMDCCRNFRQPAPAPRRRKKSRALSYPYSDKSGVVVLFSCSHGEYADDTEEVLGQDQQNSPFAKALAIHLPEPKRLDDVVKDVVAYVRAATSNDQNPQPVGTAPDVILARPSEYHRVGASHSQATVAMASSTVTVTTSSSSTAVSSSSLAVSAVAVHSSAAFAMQPPSSLSSSSFSSSAASAAAAAAATSSSSSCLSSASFSFSSSSSFSVASSISSSSSSSVSSSAPSSSSTSSSSFSSSSSSSSSSSKLAVAATSASHSLGFTTSSSVAEYTKTTSGGFSAAITTSSSSSSSSAWQRGLPNYEQTEYQKLKQLQLEQSLRTVHVSELHPGLSGQDVHECFRKAGNVIHVDMRPTTGSCLVHFASENDAKRAVATFDKVPILDKPIAVRHHAIML